MRFGEDLLEEISRRTDLVQLIGRRVKLQRKGRVFSGVSAHFTRKNRRHSKSIMKGGVITASAAARGATLSSG